MRMPGVKRKASKSSYGSKRAKSAPYTRKRYRYGAKGSGTIAKLVRKSIIRMAEPKYKLYSHGKFELYHNSGSPASGQILNYFPLNGAPQMPTQGVGDNQRNGDRINSSGIQVKMLFGQKADRPNVTFKVVFFSMRQGYAPTYSEFLENSTGNCMLDSVNTDNVTVLYQKIIKAPVWGSFALATNNTLLAREYTFFKKFWIPRKMEYKFTADGGTIHSDKFISCAVFAYDAYGSLITDNIGYFQAWTKFAYRDP